MKPQNFENDSAAILTFSNFATTKQKNRSDGGGFSPAVKSITMKAMETSTVKGYFYFDFSPPKIEKINHSIPTKNAQHPVLKYKIYKAGVEVQCLSVL